MDIETHLTRWNSATTTGLLRADGFDERDVRRLIAAGTLERVRRGAFIQPAVHELRFARASVAIARSLPGTALTHASAAAAWGLPVLDCSEHRIALAHATVGHTHSARGGDVIVRELRHPTSPLPRWPDVNAVRVEYAVLQMAQRHPAAALVAANAALHAGFIALRDVEAGVAAMRPEPGARARRRVLVQADDRIESVGETLTWLALDGLGVAVTPQVWVYDQDGCAGRVDFLDRAFGVVYEFDGDLKYDTREDLVREKRREDRLRRLGFGIVRLTWADVRQPQSVAGKVLRRQHHLRRDVVLRDSPRQETRETDSYT